jgi:PhoP regulatory network protein YrbL
MTEPPFSSATPAWPPIIARGAHRLCTHDPDDPDCCLKFELPAHARPNAGMRQRLRRALAARWRRFGENHAELRAWRWLRARLGDDARVVFAACRGFVATPWGEALRCELVRDADGAPAPSLYDHLVPERRSDLAPSQRCSVAELCAAVDALEDWLLRHRLPLFDLNAGNFAVMRDRDGRVRLRCLDGKSLIVGKEVLPLSRWLPPLRRRKLRRRAERLRQRIRTQLGETDPPS